MPLRTLRFATCPSKVWVDSTLNKVDAAAVLAGRPVRSFPTYKGQRSYPGLLWSATTGTLVGYE